MEQAGSSGATGRRPVTEADLVRALRRDPGDVRALEGLGLVYLRRGAVGRAAALFRKGLEKAPRNAELAIGLGNCHLGARDFEQAARCFERALAAEPGNLAARLGLGDVRRRQYDHEDAARHYRAALEAAPSHPEILLRLAGALRWLARHDEAAACLAEASRRRPGHPPTLVQAGLVHKAHGRLGDALACFERAAELRPGDVYARSALESLRRRIETERGGLPPDAKRVAIHMNRSFHYAVLHPIFAALAGRHHALLTDDAPDIIQFNPDIVIVADAQARRLRPLVPRAKFVFTHHGLISKNQNMESAAFSDYFCVSGEAMREIAIERSGFTPENVWMTGYVQMDALFAPDPPAPPFAVPAGHKTVLFGPAYNRQLSAAPMLGERLVELIRGARDDITIVIKPHPLTNESNGEWMRWWRRMGEADPHVHLIDSAATDVMPLLRAANLLITDACSLTFEFLPLDRPIVLLSNPKRERDPRYDPDGIEWRWRDMAEDLSDAEQLAGAVDRALADPGRYAERRAHYRRLLFGDLADGKAAERIVEHISRIEIQPIYPSGARH